MLIFDATSHVYRVDGISIPSLTQLLDADGWNQHLANVQESTLQAKADWGTRLHSALLMAEYGEGVSEEFKQHCVDWFDVLKKMKWGYPVLPIWKNAEMPALGKYEGMVFGFTPDRASPEAVVEIKGTYSPHPSHSIQTALQVIGMNYPRSTPRYIAYFDKAGLKKLHLCGPTCIRDGKTLDVYEEAERILFEHATVLGE